MPLQPSKRLALLQRRQQVAELYLRSWTQTAIAEHLGVAQPTICEDLKRIRQQWRDSAIRDFDAAREEELQKLDLLEREAWAAWKRSQEPAESTKVVQDGSGKRAQKTVEHPVGDPRYLEQVQKCIAARRALLGLDAPTRIAPVMPNGEEPFRLAVAHLSLSELRALKRLRDRALGATTEQDQQADDPSAEHD